MQWIFIVKSGCDRILSRLHCFRTFILDNLLDFLFIIDYFFLVKTCSSRFMNLILIDILGFSICGINHGCQPTLYRWDPIDAWFFLTFKFMCRTYLQSENYRTEEIGTRKDCCNLSAWSSKGFVIDVVMLLNAYSWFLYSSTLFRLKRHDKVRPIH